MQKRADQLLVVEELRERLERIGNGAPRLHDAFMAINRRAGFEPKVRNESFHTGWDLGVLAEIPAAALAPQTIAGALPDGITAVALSQPSDALETCVVWRADDTSPVVAAFAAVARSAFVRPTLTGEI